MAGLISLACFCFSALLAYKEKCGWGWFLFAGILAIPYT